MSLSKLDFISPKITLYYNGRNSHISPIGGFLSLCLLALILVLIFYAIWDIVVNPKIESSLIYKQYENNKTYQQISYSGINHFIQLYSRRDNGWFGDFDNKNIIIYSIKDNKTSSFDNLNINLANTEHWLYDKCERIFEINKNLFEEISLNIPNYTKSICIRFYYNSKTKEYYEIGFDGYVSPYLETNEIFEKKNIYKIIIDKCTNNSFINNKMGYICNNENEINEYVQVYSELFLYFINNQIIPNNYKNPFQKYFYSVTAPINKNSFFDNNINFSPIKLITEKQINNPKEISSFILNNHYSNNYSIKTSNSKIIGFFNFYLDNNIIIYDIKYLSILDGIAHLGGIAKILIFIFQILNYINYRYTVLKHTRDLFHINTGIDFNTNYNEGNELVFVKRHMTNHNYKIKVFNNNNIINTEDINHKIVRSYYTKAPEAKKKIKIYQDKKASGKKNYFALNCFSNNLNKNKETFLSKRSQTKYINNVNEIPMGKQLAIKNKEKKRKSYLSQGYFVRNETRNKFNNNSILSKNQTLFDNEMSNNEIISNNDRSNYFHFRDGTLKVDSPHRTSHETNILKSRNNSKKLKFKKTNRKKSLIENNDNITKILAKNLDTKSKGRHKSVNYTNQRKLLENNNSLRNRYGMLGKNSSGFVNESSKQFLVSNTKAPLMLLNNNIFESNKYEKFEDYSRIPTLINNNEIYTTNNNITNALNNSNIDPSNFLKNIIHNKIKFHMPEGKKNANFLESLGKKINYLDFFKSLFVFSGKNENKLCLLNNFRNKLLSEEHIYRAFINLYLIEKVFQIDEAHKFDINELYNNL